jgi:hypothetical protein
MELIPVIRQLWRRKLALGIGFLLAIVAAVVVGGSPPAAGQIAWTRVALDTPTSELVQSAPSGADTLAWRASLLVHLLGTDSVKHQLAQRMRVPAYEVAVMDTELSMPQVPASMPIRAATAASTTAAPYVLTVAVDDPKLPVISIKAAAPARDAAIRLAAAAVARLEAQSSLTDARYSSLIPTGGGAQPKLQRFVVQQVAPIRVKRVTAKSVPMKQMAVALLIFGSCFAAAVLLPRLVRRRPRLVPSP